jgi:cellulose synthase/poly-beta-1,6-N-acetylglucosamine synthase-like glycosyltransferase
MLLDADTRVQPGYFEAALPLFDDPAVAAVAGCVRTDRGRRLSAAGNLLVGHRQRIYAVGQRVMKFGQTWRRANATHIVPGFASLYRTAVLPRIEMNPPGLVIEDFNMTFEVYQKRLGKVAFSLAAVAVTQDPDNFGDYVRQTRRWALGLWQTVRRHPPRANLFSAMLALLLLELVSASLLFLLLPLVLVILAVPYLDAAALALPGFGAAHAVVAAHMNLRTVLLGVGLPDYAMTILAAAVERQPRLLLYGLAFPVLRVIDAAIGISAIPLAWLARSTGRWKSPARRTAAPHPAPDTAYAADAASGPDAASAFASGAG